MATKYDAEPKNTDVLAAICEAIAARHGFECKEVEFITNPDLVIRWQRTSDTIWMTISDYFTYASPGVFEGICECIFTKICGAEAEYGEDVVQWFKSDELCGKAQPAFISRVMGSSVDKNVNLENAVSGICKKHGLVMPPLSAIVWSDDRVDGIHYSSIARAATIPRKLDDPEMDGYLSAVVFVAVCRLAASYLKWDPNSGKGFKEEFDRLLTLWPGIRELIKEVEENTGIEIRCMKEE